MNSGLSAAQDCARPTQYQLDTADSKVQLHIRQDRRSRWAPDWGSPRGDVGGQGLAPGRRFHVKHETADRPPD